MDVRVNCVLFFLRDLEVIVNEFGNKVCENL